MLKHILYPDYESEGLASQPIFINKKGKIVKKVKGYRKPKKIKLWK